MKQLPSTIVLQPGAHWSYNHETQSALWQPYIPLNNGFTLDELNQIIENGFAEVDNHTAMILNNQLSQIMPLSFVQTPSNTSEIHIYAHQDDIQHARDIPVALAFSLNLPVQEKGIVRIANPLPPPTWGERAYINFGDNKLAIYSLTRTGDTGLHIWEEIRSILLDLAGTLEWFTFHNYLVACSTEEGHAALMQEFHSKLLRSRGDARKVVHEELRAIKEYKKQADILKQWWENDPTNTPEWTQKKERIKALSLDLASLYWQAYQQNIAPSVQYEPAPEETTQELSYTIELEGHATGIGSATAELTIEAVKEIPILTNEQRENLAIIGTIPNHVTGDTFETTNYQTDTAIREGVLAHPTAWSKQDDLYTFRSSKDISLYLGTHDMPIPSDKVETMLLGRNERYVMVARVVMGLWWARHDDPAYKAKASNAVAIRLDEIINLLGYKKRTDEHGYEIGYHPDAKKQVADAIEWLSCQWLKGRVPIVKGGNTSYISISPSQYIRITPLALPTVWGEETLVGYFILPGDWIEQYFENEQFFRVIMDRKIFKELRSDRDQYAMRIAFYLQELWREQARKKNYDEPITVQELLLKSMIQIDKKHLTERLAPAIDHAFETLKTIGIVSEITCIDTIDRKKRNWGRDWLASRWRISPTAHLMSMYEDALQRPIPQRVLPKPGKKR